MVPKLLGVEWHGGNSEFPIPHAEVWQYGGNEDSHFICVLPDWTYVDVVHYIARTPGMKCIDTAWILDEGGFAGLWEYSDKFSRFVICLPGWTFDEVISFNERNKK